MLTKRVRYSKASQRTGEGGSPVPVAISEDHFRVADIQQRDILRRLSVAGAISLVDADGIPRYRKSI
ncbi:MAG: hypothetical protein Q4F98_05705 [Lachnospiraceae bacterium]|nr:hypothetical protein [Lachnospiraceae bacterium]